MTEEADFENDERHRLGMNESGRLRNDDRDRLRNDEMSRMQAYKFRNFLLLDNALVL